VAYDNTKFNIAFEQWLKENVDVGFGEHYAGDLLDDFDEFIEDSKLMKRSPGRVVFGRKLGEQGFDKRKIAGLTYWSGLKLKKARITMPKRYEKSVEQAKKEQARREALILQDEFEQTPVAREERLRQFHRELEEEEQRLRALEDEPIQSE
jgi:hypothetical protein